MSWKSQGAESRLEPPEWSTARSGARGSAGGHSCPRPAELRSGRRDVVNRRVCGRLSQQQREAPTPRVTGAPRVRRWGREGSLRSTESPSGDVFH